MKGFLFDLDGTIVDTAIDMISALKVLAAENGVVIEPIYSEYKELITFGSKAIVSSIFGHLNDPEIVQLQKRYLEIYQKIALFAHQNLLFPVFHKVYPSHR